METVNSRKPHKLLNALSQRLSQLETECETVWIVYDSSTQKRQLFSSNDELKTWLVKTVS